MIHGLLGQTDTVAVFVDGDNLSHDHATDLLAKAAERGLVTLCRVYGDVARMPDWAADHRFSAQHAGSTRGKNNADIRLVIDAMEQALSGRARVFVIASNDGDFGPLAVRLRELGFAVMGVGRACAARAFVAACSVFVPLVDVAGPLPKEVRKTSVIPKIKVARRVVVPLDDLDTRIRQYILAHDKVGVMPLNILGSFLGSPRPYGAPTWRGVIGARPDRFLLEGKAAATRVRLQPDLMRVT